MNKTMNDRSKKRKKIKKNEMIKTRMRDVKNDSSVLGLMGNVNQAGSPWIVWPTLHCILGIEQRCLVLCCCAAVLLAGGPFEALDWLLALSSACFSFHHSEVLH